MSIPKKLKLNGTADDSDDDSDSSEEDTLNLEDYLKEEAEMETMTNAVLGACNDENCSYGEGYVKRQAVYSCADCCDLKNKPAGMCLACSINCHNGHKVYELYTKRNFRCDCGNSKFKSQCELIKDKDPENFKNKYNHNYNGLYCSCKRPFPDEERDAKNPEGSEMVQCVICEDWVHFMHLGNKVPHDNDFSEMICQKCTEHCTFLGRYKPLSVTDVPSHHIFSEADKKLFHCTMYSGDNWKEPQAKEQHAAGGRSKSCSTSHTSSPPSPSKLKKSSLKRKASYPEFPAVNFGGATFWPDKWRSALCICKDCKQMYESFGVDFITDEKDTVNFYEEKGRELLDRRHHPSAENAGVIRNMSHTQQIDIITGLNEMHEGMIEFLRSFADSGRTVTKDDITRFYAELREKNKSGSSSSFSSYNCR